jgi:hypothetical protein
MRSLPVLTILTALALLLLFSGCTGPAPVQEPAATPVTVTLTTVPAPAATPDPYPDALAPNTPVAFGTGAKTGEMTVYGYKVKPTFSWVDPSWNSPREQAESQGPFETQKGYNTKRPAEGNTFIFLYVNVAATGSEAVWAPSPGMITLYSDGKTYPYLSLGSAKTIVEGETASQYDFALGTGGTGGYVQPGRSNNVKGFLIYEVPASFVPERAYAIATPDAKVTGVWKLA